MLGWRTAEAVTPAPAAEPAASAPAPALHVAPIWQQQQEDVDGANRFGGYRLYDSKDGESLPVGAIVGMCVAALAAQSIFLATIIVLRRKKKQRKAEAEARAAEAAAAAAAAAEAGMLPGGEGSLDLMEPGKSGKDLEDSCHGGREPAQLDQKALV
ncbi:hypothetical protein COHA_009967 [Chlorella ohadii]|uniref:Uncharacterized protein n=1 Tax=Chlorella ohadii TaxID=2649997 RepID=A0AAD5H1Q8_9CHLO|nr:hypothetical protein COHA_009967 [Chlorella ohadii]